MTGPWQALAGAALRLRRRWYRGRARRLPVPVVSIGNLHLGGTGKTPLTAAVAGHLRDRGRRVAILSRGYRRRTRGLLWVSRGEGLLVEPLDAGDEPALLAETVPGVAVVVAEDRFAAGAAAVGDAGFGADVLVLDDGFSHVRLARDVDILAFPWADPLGGARLAPSGTLREPLSAVVHADAAVLTGADAEAGAETDRLAARLGAAGFRGRVFAAATRARCREPCLPGPRVLVTGIARPERVVVSASELGLSIVDHLALPDHHPYPDSSLRRISEAVARHRAVGIATTAKDAVKLRGRIDDMVVIDVDAVPEADFWSWLDYDSAISNSGSPPSTD